MDRHTSLASYLIDAVDSARCATRAAAGDTGAIVGTPLEVAKDWAWDARHDACNWGNLWGAPWWWGGY
jgi:hypothetical protein